MKITGNNTQILTLRNLEAGVPFQFADAPSGSVCIKANVDPGPDDSQVECFDLRFSCGFRADADRPVQKFPDAALHLTPQSEGEALSVFQDVGNFLKDEKKIHAIKRVREFFGLELKEAKELVDKFGWRRGEEAQRQQNQYNSVLKGKNDRIQRLEDEKASLEDEISILRAAGYGNPDTLPLRNYSIMTTLAGIKTYTLAGLIVVLVQRAKEGAPLDSPVIFQTSEGPDTLESCEVQERKLAKSTYAHDCMLVDDEAEAPTEVITIG